MNNDFQNRINKVNIMCNNLIASRRFKKAYKKFLQQEQKENLKVAYNQISDSIKKYEKEIINNKALKYETNFKIDDNQNIETAFDFRKKYC